MLYAYSLHNMNYSTVCIHIQFHLNSLYKLTPKNFTDSFDLIFWFMHLLTKLLLFKIYSEFKEFFFAVLCKKNVIKSSIRICSIQIVFHHNRRPVSELWIRSKYYQHSHEHFSHLMKKDNKLNRCIEILTKYSLKPFQYHL